MVETNTDDDGFVLPPPDFTQGDYATPYDQRAAMTLKLIKNKLDSSLLPDNIKKHIYNDMIELVNNASMTNITLGQIREFLGNFDEIWMRYKTFVNRSYRKELNYIEPTIRTMFKMNLNKSKGGFYPSLVFEQRYRYDIRQQKESPEEKATRVWGKAKPRKEVSREVEYR